MNYNKKFSFKKELLRTSGSPLEKSVLREGIPTAERTRYSGVVRKVYRSPSPVGEIRRFSPGNIFADKFPAQIQALFAVA